MVGEDAGREPAGIGGWLLFFVVALALLSPLISVVVVAASLYGDPAVGEAYGDGWPALQAFEWGLTAVAIALAWYLAWRLVARRTWRTVRIVIMGIWLTGPVALALDFAGVSLIAAIPLGPMLADAGADFSRSIFGCTLWTAYLLRSVRVANTYPRRPQAESLAEVFG